MKAKTKKRTRVIVLIAVILAVILAAALLFLLMMGSLYLHHLFAPTSPAEPSPAYVYKEGLENFSVNDSEFSLGFALMPAGLENQFAYTDGNYFFKKSDRGGKDTDYERMLCYFAYDSENYEKAKAYTFENLDLGTEPVGTCGNYTVYINYTVIGMDWRGKFPRYCNTVICNDSTKTLIFTGMDELYATVQDKENGLLEYLVAYYGDFYDFQ